MQLDALSFEELHPLFVKHGLKAIDHSGTKVTYGANGLVIALTHDPKENSNTLWVGQESNLVEIDDIILKQHFKSELQLSNLPLEKFVSHVLLFFLGDGKELLKGNREALIGLVNYSEERSKTYTANLVEKRQLELANGAWNDGNYAEVVRLLERIDTNNLPESVKHKLRIAKEKLEK